VDQKIIIKYKGTTLIEIMIALALTSFAMTLAVIIYLNIQKSTLPFFKLKASEMGNKCLNETINNHDYFDKQFEESGFFISRSVQQNRLYGDCYDITVTVFDGDKKKLAALQTTVYAE